MRTLSSARSCSRKPSLIHHIPFFVSLAGQSVSAHIGISNVPTWSQGLKRKYANSWCNRYRSTAGYISIRLLGTWLEELRNISINTALDMKVPVKRIVSYESVADTVVAWTKLSSSDPRG